MKKLCTKNISRQKNEEAYRLEFRNAHAFIKEGKHGDLRQALLSGAANFESFFQNKEHFLDASVKEKAELMKMRLLAANDMDYDKKQVPCSALYNCKKCKSNRVQKIDKQTRAGDEPMTSFFTCADCGLQWKN